VKTDQIEFRAEDVHQAAIVLSALAKAEWQKLTGQLYAFMELYPHPEAHIKPLVESFIGQMEERI
jgi:hypothetical protein